MSALCNGKLSLSPDDFELAAMLRRRGFPDLARHMTADEKVRRYFGGLAVEPEWKHALPLANAILKAFGVLQEDWPQWRESALKKYETDEGVKSLLIGRGTSVSS
ncbi:hypothetical protein LZ554_006226 [Drepanopeziza brunnea f. sp. 'monogermtubi']|nr:hypothetical protein LZ554_006226 [Drepanopeziza brunnea f. sp. 'monogermtubi']